MDADQQKKIEDKLSAIKSDFLNWLKTEKVTSDNEVCSLHFSVDVRSYTTVSLGDPKLTEAFPDQNNNSILMKMKLSDFFSWERIHSITDLDPNCTCANRIWKAFQRVDQTITVADLLKPGPPFINKIRGIGKSSIEIVKKILADSDIELPE